MREKEVHNVQTGSFWATSLLFSLVQELVPIWLHRTETRMQGTNAVIEKYNAFVSRAEALGLLSAVDAPPILSVSIYMIGRFMNTDVIFRVAMSYGCWKESLAPGQASCYHAWLRGSSRTRMARESNVNSGFLRNVPQAEYPSTYQE